MVQMTFSEALSAIKRVYPDDHIFFEEFVRELIVVVIGLRRGHAVDLLHLSQVAAVAMSLHVVVLNEHLLTDVVAAKLIRQNVGLLSDNLVFNFILFSDDRSSRVQLAEVVHHSVLDVHVNFSEYIRSALSLLHGNVCER